MKHKKFEEKKIEFDNKVMLYLMHKLFTDIKDSDAFKEELIDGVGNPNNTQTKDNKWAFTSLDKWLMNFKTKSKDSLKEELGGFSWLKDFDPLYLINIDNVNSIDFKVIMEGWKQVITQVEDSEFLPDKIQRTRLLDEFGSKDDMSFRDRLSLCITISTILLYTLINEKLPSSVEFTHNVCPSVETCFWITPNKDYEKLISYLKENDLLDNYNKITNKGLRLVVSVAKAAMEYNLLNKKIEREENKYNIWEKLSKL